MSNRQQQIQAEYNRFRDIREIAHAKGFDVWPRLQGPRLNEAYQITELGAPEPGFSGRSWKIILDIEGIERCINTFQPRAGF